MTEQKTLAKKTASPITVLKAYLSNENVKKRLEEMIGKRAGAFTNSIINIYRNSSQLQKCTPESIGSAAMRAATFNLPIDPALGQAAIVPYKNTANFQLMYKGLTQLCIRSGQYATIHCSEVYADEIKSHNPITGEVTFNDPVTFKMRYKDKTKNIVGHYSYFKLLSGFEKSDYMTTEEAMAHGKKYSAAYKYDLAQKKRGSMWSTDPVPMCNKTVLIRLLTKYGVMSIEIQEALINERVDFVDAQEASESKVADEAGKTSIDTEFEPKEQSKATKAKIEKQKADLAAAETKDKNLEDQEFMKD